MRGRTFLAIVIAAHVVACKSTPTESGAGVKQKARFETLPENALHLDFERGTAGAPPEGFRLTVTGAARLGNWVLLEAPDAPSARMVLAQIDADKTEERAPLCVYEPLLAADVHAAVRFKTISGKVEQAAGLVARYRGREDYYLVRADALEGNVRLYKVLGGKRKQLAGISVPVTPDEWHSLGLDVRGSRFQAFFDGRMLFEARDATFTEPGRVGVWTQADSVTWFDDLVLAALAAAK